MRATRRASLTQCDLSRAARRIDGRRTASSHATGSAAQLPIRGAASNLIFDDQRLDAVGGAMPLATPGWDTATHRWAIELTGGSSDLSVVEE